MILPSWDLHASELEQCELLAALIRCQKPDVVVESGTYKGHAALYMASACKTNGKGHVWTADPEDHGVVACAEENSISEWLTYQAIGFEEMLKALDTVDFAYIDGSGPPYGAGWRVRHFEMVREKLSPGGIICVDDTWADDWADEEGGQSVARIRDACHVNFRFLRGLSVFHAEL